MSDLLWVQRLHVGACCGHSDSVPDLQTEGQAAWSATATVLTSCGEFGQQQASCGVSGGLADRRLTYCRVWSANSETRGIAGAADHLRDH
jgi:hypothetical protein